MSFILVSISGTSMMINWAEGEEQTDGTGTSSLTNEPAAQPDTTSIQTSNDILLNGTSIRTLANSELLHKIMNTRLEFNIHPKVFDWSPDGKSLLVGLDMFDFKEKRIGPVEGPWFLALTDVTTGSIQRINLTMTAHPNEIYPLGYWLKFYQAKFSSSGDSIYYLVGGSNPEDRHPESIFRYNLTTGMNQLIINGTDISSFDIATQKNDTLAYLTKDGHIHFYPEDPINAKNIESAWIRGNLSVVVDLANPEFAVSPDGKQFVFLGHSSQGIKYIYYNSNRFQHLDLPTQFCVGSMAFAPDANYLLYVEYGGQQCPGNSSALHILRLGEQRADYVVYKDSIGPIDTVASPDGLYLATIATGSNEHYSSYYSTYQEPNPRIVVIQLSRPIPEFGSVAAASFSLVIVVGVIVGIRSIKVGINSKG